MAQANVVSARGRLSVMQWVGGMEEKTPSCAGKGRGADGPWVFVLCVRLNGRWDTREAGISLSLVCLSGYIQKGFSLGGLSTVHGPASVVALSYLAGHPN